LKVECPSICHILIFIVPILWILALSAIVIAIESINSTISRQYDPL